MADLSRRGFLGAVASLPVVAAFRQVPDYAYWVVDTGEKFVTCHDMLSRYNYQFHRHRVRVRPGHGLVIDDRAPKAYGAIAITYNVFEEWT